jgi:hypothetical protein
MSTHLRFSSSKFPNAKLRVLCFSFLQDGDVWVSIFRQREKIFEAASAERIQKLGEYNLQSC